MYNFLAIFISKIYNILFSFFDRFFLKKRNTSNYYERCFKLLSFNEKLFFDKKNKEEKINKYLTKLIFRKKKIYELIHSIFISSDFKKKISDLTGLNYSIDYFVAYQTKSIDKKDLKLGWYANHWHKDKPFSKYFIKLIIPMENIDIEKGGIELINGKKFNFKNSKNFKYDYKMVANTKQILIFSPNLCYHRAGKLSKNKKRKQIMLQLNPSKKWSINKDLYALQTKKEPKFPFFSYFLSNYKDL